MSDSEEGKIEIHDRELQRLLHLTTADLRFADIIIKAVLGEDTDDPYLDGTGTKVMLDGRLRGLSMNVAILWLSLFLWEEELELYYNDCINLKAEVLWFHQY